MLRNYLLTGLRSLLKNKTFTLINILGLSIGMTAALLVLNYVSFEFSYDQMHHKKDRIYRVESRFYEGKEMTDDWPTSSFGYASAMKREISGIEDFTRVDIQQNEQIVSREQHCFREDRICYTDPGFFRLFDYKLIEGDRQTALSRPKTVVISELMAQKYFNGKNPIGKSLSFSTTGEKIQCEVTGIMENIPANAHTHYDFLISWETLPNWKKEYWYIHEVYSYVLLSPNVKPESIEAAFPALAEKYKTEPPLKNKTWAIKLQPLTKIHLTPQKSYEREVKGNRKAVIALILIAIAILCIAWINYINLTTARSLERAKEIGIRKVSGAGKHQLTIQFLFESLLVNLPALILALIILQLILPLFNRFTGMYLDFSLWANGYFWIALLIILISGILLSGFYPAFILSSIRPSETLKGKYIRSQNAGIIRTGLVVIQFLASFLLICGTLIVHSQLRFMQTQDNGIKTKQTLVIKYPAYTENLTNKVLALKREIKNIPGVKNVTISGAVPGAEVANFASNRRTNDPTAQNRLYEMLPCDPDYLDAYDLKLVAGRGFSANIENNTNTLVINEEAVKLLGFKSNEEAVGQLVSLESLDTPMQIGGVVKNYHQQSLNKEYTPIIFLMYNKIGWLSIKYISIGIEGGNQAELVEKVKSQWQRFFPESSYDYFFLDQFFNKQYQQDERFGAIFSLFSILAIFIACLGLWALAMFTGLTRTKEMGIRKVLGASSPSLINLLATEFMKLIGVAVLIGIPVSWLIMNEWLNNYAFRIKISWWFFVIPALIIFVISALTITVQTLKIVRTNPSESLKYE
ncbi:MAG: ABC transporter permease [Bacteroidota bacterium]|nr:ABC transporter permease [Bacteroidota bacterium]